MTRSAKLRLAAFLVIILMFVAGGWLSMSSRSTATYVATVGVVLPILPVTRTVHHTVGTLSLNGRGEHPMSPDR